MTVLLWAAGVVVVAIGALIGTIIVIGYLRRPYDV
jgi:hypothetical protein